ncbi:MAG: CoA transferase [Dehalococcoidia bacterium]
MTPQPQGSPSPHPTGPLAPYRLLDLADEKGQLCARLLGELGADVIKVEPPGEGDPTRQNGPFFKGEQGPNTSLYWWAMNAGKRSVTCQLRLQPGRELLHRLVATADIVVETNPPGSAAGKGLDYATLSAVNPAIILVSITNWGQAGPFAAWESADIVASAMGGHMHLNGEPERGPVRTTAPQAFTQVNVQAAVGALIALYARGVNGGVGQHVDASMQEAMTNAMDNSQQMWDILRINNAGPGVRRNAMGKPGPRYLFETSDGWVALLQLGGLAGVGANATIDWLAEHGDAGDLVSSEWRERLTSLTPLGEAIGYVEERLAAFCRKWKKEDLVAAAQARGLGWAPVFGPREIVESKQLAARDYWVRVQHDDIGQSFIYPGAPWKLSRTPWKQRGRAPACGEHTAEVYGDLLGMDAAEVRRLKAKMVI